MCVLAMLLWGKVYVRQVVGRRALAWFLCVRGSFSTRSRGVRYAPGADLTHWL